MTPDQVRDFYESYFAADSRRNKGMSIGLPLAQWIAAYRETRPEQWVACDLGSGFSSVLLRMVGPGTVTIDGDSRWLAMTREELTSRQLDHDCLFVIDDSAVQDYAVYGAMSLVLMDLGAIPFRKGVGGAESRLKYAPLAISLLAEDGVLVLDDWHNADYARRMTALLTAQGFTVTPLPETTDEFGRFAAIARRESPVTRSAERGLLHWLKLETKS